jgi:hypothetical protein
MEARLTEMGVDIPLKEAPTAYAGRRPCGFDTVPTRVADLSFVRGFEQFSTQSAEGREKNDLERSQFR